MIGLDKKLKVVFLLMAFGLCAGILSSCRAPKKSPAVVMEEYLEAARRFWNFQGSVLVANDGDVVYEAGIGMARLEEGVENTTATRFLIGSVTKTFTAAAILHLADEGRLELDNPLRKYVPEFPEKSEAPITIRHLLSHTSGVPEIIPDPRVIGDLTMSRDPLELLALIADRPLDFEPGENASYSNTGYLLLGLVIERVSNEPYYDYIQEHILNPLGMTSSGYREDWHDASGFARGYIEGPGGRLVEAPRIHLSLGFSAGALHSTVRDLLRWDRGLGMDGILSSESRDNMSRDVKGGFGYGWLVMETWGKKDLAHGGGVPGFSSWIERWPEDGVFVAVLSNNGSSSVGEIGRSLVAIFFGKDCQFPEAREISPVNPATLDDYVGAYKIDAENTREILREGNALFVRRNGGRRYPVLPYSEDRFFFPNDRGTTIRFLRDGEGKITGHVFHQLGLDETATKLN